MRATLARQSGSRKPLLRPRRTTQRTVVIGARPAPLLSQNGFLASTACTFSTTCVLASVCTFRRAVVIRVRPAPSVDQHGLLATTACTFSTTGVFAYVCSFRRSVVIRVRPAPSFNQHGLLASTACTFLRRPMLIMFGRFQKTCTPLRREARFGRLGCLLEAPGPLREASRPPKAP